MELTQEETDRFVFELLAAGMAGKPTVAPSWLPADAQFGPTRPSTSLGKAKKLVYDHLASLPGKVSDDLETQEAVRAEVDRIVFDIFGGLTSLLGIELR